jgi:hypothetical protein
MRLARGKSVGCDLEYTCCDLLRAWRGPLEQNTVAQRPARAKKEKYSEKPTFRVEPHSPATCNAVAATVLTTYMAQHTCLTVETHKLRISHSLILFGVLNNPISDSQIAYLR